MKSHHSWPKKFVALLNKYSEDHIRNVIKFTFHEPNFWKDQLQSPAGFGKYFIKLETLMAKKNINPMKEKEIVYTKGTFE